MNEHVREKVWVHLYGGAMDGLRRQVNFECGPPERIHLVDGIEDYMILDLTVHQQQEMQEKFDLLAYQFDCATHYLDEFEIRYTRLESADSASPE